MKKILTIFYLIVFGFLISSCERELESEGIAAGVIRFPSILVLGNDPFVEVAGNGFTDPGAQAFLGTDDITDQLETTSDVDPNNAGLYSVNYSVSTTNELGTESTVNQSRVVLITSEDLSDVDLAGSYLRDNDPANPVVTMTKVTTGVYSFQNIFGSATVVNGFRLYHLGGTILDGGIQNSQFGRIQTTGSLTANGFDVVYSFLDPPNTGIVIGRSFVKQ